MCYIGVTEGKIENLKKRRHMRISILIFIYTIHFTYTKFHNPKSNSCWENLRKMSYMCYKGVTEGKIEKEGKLSFSIFIFIYTIHLAYLKVYTKFENTGSNRSREICDRNFHWRERKNEQIKGLICYMWLFLLHNTPHHYQALYQICTES